MKLQFFSHDLAKIAANNAITLAHKYINVFIACHHLCQPADFTSQTRPQPFHLSWAQGKVSISFYYLGGKWALLPITEHKGCLKRAELLFVGT